MGLSDYKRATKVAARSTGSWVSAFINVLWARTKFGIGPRYHSLFEFGKRRVGEWDCYIPDSESNPIIRKLNGEDLSLAVDKEKFASHCINNMLPTIPILAVVTNKVKGHVSGVVRISKSEELDSFLKDCPDGIFIKLSDGAHGDGAIVAYREGLCWRFDEKVGDAQELMRFLRRLSLPDVS